MQFVLATANPHKAREIAEIFRAVHLEIDLLPRPVDLADVDETGDTFEENARLKAVAVCAATGLPTLADDSGLEVDALGGAPGVHSARFAGIDADSERKVVQLLELLREVPDVERTARFVAVAIARFPDGREVAAIGTVEGSITREPRTAPEHGGFGYDPVFVPEEGDGRTFAQMPATAKHEVSHRGRAFRTLADGLRIMDATG